MITYKQVTKVYLDGRQVGEIRPVKGTSGHAYYPKGSNGRRGELFRTVAEVKKSLEED